MSDLKYSSLWAIAIVVITVLVFAINYNGYPDIFPIYKVLAWPGIVTLRLFSEEINFIPKLSILMIGQFLTYFFAIFLVRKIVHRFK